MCLVLKEDLDTMLLAIGQYVNVNNLKNPRLSDNLKDYLAELEDCGLISYCGCEGLFEVKIVDESVLVYIDIVGSVTKFVINDSPYHEPSTHSEASDNYDDFIGEDYLEM